MTSRDLTENVEQLQVRDAMVLVRDRTVATLAELARLATAYADMPMAARSHNVPAQVTTLGKRFAVAGEELLVAFERLDALIARYPLRGIKGPVGHPDRPARPARVGRRPSTRSKPRSPATSASTARSPTSARCIPARSTSRWSAPSCSWRRRRRAWPPPSG